MSLPYVVVCITANSASHITANPTHWTCWKSPDALKTRPLSSLCRPVSGLVSSRETNSGRHSGARSSTEASARGRGKTTCTRNKLKRRYSTCSHPTNPQTLNTSCPSPGCQLVKHQPNHLTTYTATEMSRREKTERKTHERGSGLDEDMSLNKVYLNITWE